MVSPQITKRSSTIIRGSQMKSWALRRSSGSLTTLLWDLYDGPLHSHDGPPKCSFMGFYTAMGPGQIAPCNPQSWVGGGSCSVSFVFLTLSWDNLLYSIRAKNAILVKSCQFCSASRFEMSSDCTPGIACDKFSPAPPLAQKNCRTVK